MRTGGDHTCWSKSHVSEENSLRRGFNSSHSGNMSVLAGDHIFITRRGSMLANPAQGDIIEIPMDTEGVFAARSSR